MYQVSVDGSTRLRSFDSLSLCCVRTGNKPSPRRVSIISYSAQSDKEGEGERSRGERAAKTVSVRSRKHDETSSSQTSLASRDDQLDVTASRQETSTQATGLLEPLLDSLQNRFGELALIAGDVGIMATTFLTSSLFPMSDIPAATYTVVACWVLVGMIRGDYKPEATAEEAAWIPGFTVFTGILCACFTWLFSTPLVLLVYAVLVSHGLISADPVMNVAVGGKVSPVLEVQVALLIVMTSWRGLYFGFRDGVL